MLAYGRLDVPTAPQNAVVCLRSLVRDDYKALFGSIISTLHEWPVVRVEDYLTRQQNLNPDMIDGLLKNVDALKERLDIDCPERRAAVAVRMAMHEQVATRTLALEPAAVICFASMQPAEHLTALVARRRGLPTVTVQHGLYVEYRELETINTINYEHQPCEYFLAWGEHTAHLIDRYHDDVETRICGKPAIHTGSPPQTPLGGPSLMVITDQIIFDEANRELLDLAVKFARRNGMKVKARFHPSNPRAEYLRLFPDLIEDPYFLDCDLVLGHTSSLIYEALSLGKRTLRYRTETPAIELPDSLTFTSLEELLQKGSASVEPEVTQRYISCTGEESAARYRLFFSELVRRLKTADPARQRA